MQSQSALQCRSGESEKEGREGGGSKRGRQRKEMEKGGAPEQKKEGESKSKEGKDGVGGGIVKQRNEESLRHPLVSPGTFLCTRNDCTRSASRIWEGGGRCRFKTAE